LNGGKESKSIGETSRNARSIKQKKTLGGKRIICDNPNPINKFEKEKNNGKLG